MDIPGRSWKKNMNCLMNFDSTALSTIPNSVSDR